MTNMSKLALIAVVALTASTSIASAAFPIKIPQPNKPHTHSNMIIECRVRDDNFWIINFGDKNLDSGLQVAWRSPSTDDSGVVLLPKMLAPGDEVKLAGVLSDFADGGDPCSAALV